MRINFVYLGEVEMASYRFRALTPYEDLTSLGHYVTIKNFPDLDADINIFQKHVNPNLTLEYMDACKTTKIFDVCDDYFDKEFGDFYKAACTKADILTCTNERMEKRLKSLFPKKSVSVFYDPINTLWGPHKAPVEHPKVIWFGHHTNFQGAMPWLTEVVNANYDLTVVCNLPNLKGGDFKFVPYQNGWVEEHLKEYDVVLLPTGDAPEVQHKSENRFVDALNAGCAVITNNDVLYKDLIPFGIYETGSVIKGFEKYHKEQPKVFEGKLYIQDKYNEEVRKEQWKQVLNLI